MAGRRLLRDRGLVAHDSVLSWKCPGSVTSVSAPFRTQSSGTLGTHGKVCLFGQSAPSPLGVPLRAVCAPPIGRPGVPLWAVCARPTTTPDRECRSGPSAPIGLGVPLRAVCASAEPKLGVPLRAVSASRSSDMSRVSALTETSPSPPGKVAVPGTDPQSEPEFGATVCHCGQSAPG